MAFLSRCLVTLISSIVIVVPVARAEKYSIESVIDSRLLYDDNLFLSSLERDVTRFSIRPKLTASVSEASWSQDLELEAAAYLYSDDSLNNNDLFFVNYGGVVIDEKNSYSFNVDYSKDTNLNQASADFGLEDSRVESTAWSVGPSYQFQWSQRLILSLGINRTNKEYDGKEDTGYIGYVIDAATITTSWQFDERTSSSLLVEYSEYVSEGESFVYDRLTTSISLNLALSEIWTTSGSIGYSDRASTSRIEDTFDLFGTTVTVFDEVDAETSSTVADLVLEGGFESSALTLSHSRNEQANPYGGLNEVEVSRITYRWRPLQRWTYTLTVRNDDYEAVTQGTQVTDRRLSEVSLSMSHSLARHWQLTATYRYREHEFTAINDDSVRVSNRITLGMRYIFPELSSD